MKITLMGAAKCVTGSCTLLEFEGKKILVDCGMRQGRDAKEAPSEFGFAPEEIDAVFLTHAHIDHSGLIPLLVKRGYKGKVHCTEATAKLCSIMFPDAGHIQEMETEWENRKNARAGKPLVEPLYTAEEARAAIKSLNAHGYGRAEIMDGVAAEFVDAGHLLGASSIKLLLTENGKQNRLVFSGDIGNTNIPLMKDPVYITDDVDIVFMETTYGDRLRDPVDPKEAFRNALTDALRTGGNIVIPSFAVGRTQELLYEISVFLDEGSVPGLENVPVYIDSPLGIAATQIFESEGPAYYDDEAKAYEAEGIRFFSFATLRVAKTTEESKAINFDEHQKIIISSSGMCDAGRIKHHLKHNLWRADSTVIFVGYQAAGTLGRSILDGAKHVRICGEEIRVNANIVNIEGFSGHADKAGLLEWIKHFPKTVKRVFLMHGEEQVMRKFAQDVRALGYNVLIPELYATYDSATFEKAAEAPHIMEKAPVIFDIREILEKLRLKAESGSVEQAEAIKRDLRALAQKWGD